FPLQSLASLALERGDVAGWKRQQAEAAAFGVAHHMHDFDRWKMAAAAAEELLELGRADEAARVLAPFPAFPFDMVFARASVSLARGRPGETLAVLAGAPQSEGTAWPWKASYLAARAELAVGDRAAAEASLRRAIDFIEGLRAGLVTGETERATFLDDKL